MSYNEKSDIWSLGCLLYELCALRPPFLATNQKDLAVKICCGTFTRLPLRYSQDLNNILAYMLQVEVSIVSGSVLVLCRSNFYILITNL